MGIGTGGEANWLNWIERETSNLEVPGSSPGLVALAPL